MPRSAIWVGHRGADALALPPAATTLVGVLCCDWSGAFAQQLAGVQVDSVERVSGVRERWSSAELRRLDPSSLRSAVARAAMDEVLVVPYRSLHELGRIARLGAQIRVAGADPELVDRLDDKLHQRQLFLRLGIRCPAWTVVARGAAPPDDARWYPGVLQGRYGSLGASTVPVDSPHQVLAAGAALGEGPLLLSERLEGPVLNLHVVVGERGVHVSWPSIQIVGARACSGPRATFAYCGNDFSAAQLLPAGDRQQLLSIAAGLGSALAVEGYRGLFGLDAIQTADGPRVLEINPRFQGSTRRLAMAEAAEGRPSTVGAHLDAFEAREPHDLRTEPPRSLSGSQLIVYHTGRSTARVVRTPILSGVELDGWPSVGTEVRSGAILGRIHLAGPALSANLTTLSGDAEVLARDARRTCVGDEVPGEDRA